MSEHTPGPWHVWHETHVMAGERLVAACGGYANNARPAYDENAANARLIAAAPDMLAACKQLVEACGNPTDLRLGSEQLQRFISAWGDMRRAVAKAEGTS